MSNSIQSAITGVDNGTVSKILMKGEGGNITIFSFDKGQSLDNHSTPRKVMILVLEGEMEFSLGLEKMYLKKDDYLLLNESEEHSLLAKTPLKILLIILKS